MEDEVVQAVLYDWQSAPIHEKLQAMLGVLEKITLTPAQVTPSDIRPLLELGISQQAIEDALLICACFNLIARVADALGVAIPSPVEFAVGADRLLAYGYLQETTRKPHQT